MVNLRLVGIVGEALMDNRFRLNEIEFIWDAQKAASNFKKHVGVTFELAWEAFFDPFLQVVDGGIVEEEVREAILGLTDCWQLLQVVYAMRDDEIRIISARLTTKAERRIYEN